MKQKKLWEGTKRQIEVINDDDPIEYRKNIVKLGLNQTKTCP